MRLQRASNSGGLYSTSGLGTLRSAIALTLCVVASQQRAEASGVVLGPPVKCVKVKASPNTLIQTMRLFV
uniref:Uncharacterized protein n=1 Tax=Knipowitschia caucasica TaxID=637954 RepID=A0AAV2KZK1_KNICA